MALTGDLALFEARLDAAIDAAMQAEIADGAKEALQRAAGTEVYDAYAPEFYSRRGAAGGIADTANMTASYVDKTLTITDDAPWQQLWGGSVPTGKLAEAIAAGDSRYNMGNAGPRPFHQEAEREFSQSGEFARLLAQGLRMRGFDVKGG